MNVPRKVDQLSVISYQLSVISYQLSVISYQLSVEEGKRQWLDFAHQPGKRISEILHVCNWFGFLDMT
ncbi:MAG: hypothetical protein EAZ87_23895 [Nostocales cyanobacterium]|nr:MAG: hypothetical protein EAZ87_23895 [Nostocales cyanobacterium]